MANNHGAQGSLKESARAVRKPGYLEFKAALLEFADAPTPATLDRYLTASRALEGLDPPPRRPAEPVNRHDHFALPSR